MDKKVSRNRCKYRWRNVSLLVDNGWWGWMDVTYSTLHSYCINYTTPCHGHVLMLAIEHLGYLLCTLPQWKVIKDSKRVCGVDRQRTAIRPKIEILVAVLAPVSVIQALLRLHLGIRCGIWGCALMEASTPYDLCWRAKMLECLQESK